MQGLFLTMLLDIVPNAVSHLGCEALLSHHLVLYFLPGHLGRQIAIRDPWVVPHCRASVGPPEGAVLEQKLPFTLYSGANLPLVSTEAGSPLLILFYVSQSRVGSEKRRVTCLGHYLVQLVH